MAVKSPRKIAFLHRYGLAGWIRCGGHCLPRVFEILHAQGVELHVYGPASHDTLAPEHARHVILHTLPFTWNRANPRHKWTHTMLWYLCQPMVCLHCRVSGIDAVFHDETLPLSGWIMRLFFGRRTALTVMDFFMRIYTQDRPLLRPVGRVVEWLDLCAWKRMPVLFTKVTHTQSFLMAAGIPASHLFIARNPCNHRVFHPVSPEERTAARQRLGLGPDDFVLTHHGIMHPNKGNDWLLRRLAELAEPLPALKLILIGDGPARRSLEQLAGTLRIADRVTFTGWLPTEEDLNLALNAGDVGLVMRIGQETDHFHMTDTLSHEMACAKPILAINLRGIAEVIQNGENGLLFSHENPAEFREQLMALHGSAERRAALGRAALATSLMVSDMETCARQLALPLLALAGGRPADTPTTGTMP